MDRITEQPSKHRNLETKSIDELIGAINEEDHQVAPAIRKALPQISRLITAIVDKLEKGGRMFYVGAGSGGRLSVLDVIEIPTTYGVPKGMLNVVLAGGVERLADALEEKEDDISEGWSQLEEASISQKDIVIGVSASGTTPFVLETLRKCKENGIVTGCLVNNLGSPVSKFADFPIEVITGQEFVTGSTRMKAGTSQKMMFDMISTTAMIQLGRVEDNSMVNVKLINEKITDRAVRILMDKINMDDYDKAKHLLLKEGSVKKAIDSLKNTSQTKKLSD